MYSTQKFSGFFPCETVLPVCGLKEEQTSLNLTHRQISDIIVSGVEQTDAVAFTTGYRLCVHCFQ